GVAGCGRAGGAGPALHVAAARGAREQCRCDRALPAGRLSPVRPARDVLWRQRRRLALAEAALSRAGPAPIAAALFPPNDRVHLWSSLPLDGVGLGRSSTAARPRIRV